MITYEEYDKKKDDEAEDLENLPTTAVVITIVLSSLIGVFIVFDALLGIYCFPYLCIAE